MTRTLHYKSESEKLIAEARSPKRKGINHTYQNDLE